jgi:hypothetical protein
MTDPVFDEPLDPELATLLGRERSDPAFASSKERLARRLAIAAVAATAGASLATPKVAPAGASHAPVAAGSAASGVAAKLLRAILLMGVGGAVGATLQAHRDQAALALSATSLPAIRASAVPRPEPTQPPASTATPPPGVPVVDVDSLPLARAQASGAPSARLPAPSASASARPATSLGEEQRLLDTARTAVGRGAFSAALATLDEHEARFPKGHLLEERELLRVQALAGAGRDAEARDHAAQFEARYPGSIFLPAVREALDTRPR